MPETLAFSAAGLSTSVRDADGLISTCNATLSGKRGELVQGQTTSGLDFLCAMPFPIAASARITLHAGRHISTDPNGMHRTANFARTLLDIASLHEVGGHVKFTLHEKIGVGCGTSSQMMQLVHNALAAEGCAMLNFSEYGRLIASLEPNDFFCSNGFTQFWEYKRGLRLSEAFSPPPACYVAGYPIGQTLYTNDVDRRRPRYTASELHIFDDIFAEFVPAARRADTRALGEMTCASADINDVWFSKPNLPNLRSLVKQRIADGYFVAHSGTIVGAFHSDPEALDSLLAAFTAAVGRDYDIAGFAQTADTRKYPFLFSCGSTLRRFVSR
jgi:uncharacterized protein involved in propanediol utilization